MPYKDPEIRKKYHSEYNKNLTEGQKYRKGLVQSLWWKSPQGKYTSHRNQAVNKRRIPWEFTFETWWKVWEDSGKWEQRGANTDQYCMCRFRDEGPYSPDNVYIALAADNKRDAFINNKVPTPTGLFYKDLNCE